MGKGLAMLVQDPLTERIIGCCFRVANGLGPGFVEKIYENALGHELRKLNLGVVQQQKIEVFYDGISVGQYEADLLVEGRVIVEVKAIQALDNAHLAQCLNYLRGTGLMTGLLVNFGRGKIQLRRLTLGRNPANAELELNVDSVQ